MRIEVFSCNRRQTVKDFVLDVLSSEGFTYDPDKDLDLDDISTNYFALGGIFYVADIENKIVGTCAVKKLNIEKCEIKRLYVHPEYRRQNIGALLLNTALKFANENYKIITLKTQYSLLPAIALYLKTGFKIIKKENDVIYFKK